MSKIGHSDILLGSKYPIEPGRFVEIRADSQPRKIAVVDGGSGILEKSLSFLIMINRTYFSIFRGGGREEPKTKPRVEFFSTVTARVGRRVGSGWIRYSTEIYPRGPEDVEYLPGKKLLHDGNDASEREWDMVSSMARKFAEWSMCLHVVEKELSGGDVLVIDGSLQTSFKNEAKHADRVYDAARRKGVIVCGLAKTSRLVTASGESLLARVTEISKDVEYGRWYVRVSDGISPDDRGVLLVAKFHPLSEFVFRFEILRDQFVEMDDGEVNSILASIAANSADAAMVGYPYAAIDADRFAQVRLNELDMYRNMILAEATKVSGWRSIYEQCEEATVHQRLNEVTS